jgi:predicted transcriptional regulator
MRKDGHRNLSRRERQIMDILYQRGRASASEIHEALPEPPSYSAVRAKLRVLEEKGHVRHEEQALRYVYLPTLARDTAR